MRLTWVLKIEEVTYWSAFIKAGGDKMSALWVLLVGTHSDIAIARGRIMLDLSKIYHCVFTEWKSTGEHCKSYFSTFQ